MAESDSLRRAVRLHLASLTPRQRAALARGEHVEPDVRAACAAVTDAHVDGELERCARRGIRIVGPADPRWPPLLREIPDPPQALWVRGELPEPAILPIAVVGPRRPTAYGLYVAERLSTEVAKLGALVVSGGARGVDATAHRAALRARERTIAILGCGVDVVYPPGHGQLYERIAASGAVISELPCATPPLKHHFPVRNRLLAGWSRAVLVVEATFKSGSLITARLALDFGRDVLAVPGPVTSPLSEGTNDLLAGGARVLRTVQDLLGELRDDEIAGLRLPASGGGAPAPEDASDPVLSALPSGQAVSVEEMVEATGLGAGALLGRLVSLETSGRAACLEGGLWMRREGTG